MGRIFNYIIEWIREIVQLLLFPWNALLVRTIARRLASVISQFKEVPEGISPWLVRHLACCFAQHQKLRPCEATKEALRVLVRLSINEYEDQNYRILRPFSIKEEPRYGFWSQVYTQMHLDALYKDLR